MDVKKPESAGDVSYSLRISRSVWRAAKAKAAYEGRTLRFVVTALLRVYAKYGFTVVEAYDGKERE